MATQTFTTPKFRHRVEIGLIIVGIVLFVLIGIRAIVGVSDRRYVEGSNQQEGYDIPNLAVSDLGSSTGNLLIAKTAEPVSMGPATLGIASMQDGGGPTESLVGAPPSQIGPGRPDLSQIRAGGAVDAIVNGDLSTKVQKPNNFKILQ